MEYRTKIVCLQCEEAGRLHLAGSLKFFTNRAKGHLTTAKASLKSAKQHLERQMQPLMTTPCKHPKVRVVAREEDAEYVECQDCGEVFDLAELRDIQDEAEHSGDAEEDESA